MRKEFLGALPNNETKAVKAFVKSNAENALKTKPKVRDEALLFVSLVIIVVELSPPWKSSCVVCFSCYRCTIRWHLDRLSSRQAI